MRGRGGRRVPVRASLLALALTAGACSTSGDFEQVEQAPLREDDTLPTTAHVVASTLTPTSSGPAASRTATTGPASEQALASMIGQLVSEPGLIAAVGQLPDASPATLAAMFGLDEQVIDQLQLTLAEIQGVAALIAGIDPQQLVAAFGSRLGESIDVAALDGLLTIARNLDAAAIAAIDGLSTQVVGSISSALSDAVEIVDPALIALFAALLDQYDPEGLGALTANPSTTSVLAVFTAASMRANPALTDRVDPHVRADPTLMSLISRLDSLGRSLEPAQASALAAVGSQLTPRGLLALTQVVTVLGAPTTQDLFARLPG